MGRVGTKMSKEVAGLLNNTSDDLSGQVVKFVCIPTLVAS